ncbi:Gfo/Idh/MocA family protein [Paenibacillus sp. GCM10027626]|uniref:Gfo/Idh/MocA family protein n=1 Tax=Paenibacillus sp. GCM10027626 TaxID=3273411 RepID=UPI0036327957
MTLHIGMIGNGGFSKKHAQQLSAMDGVKVSAICGSSKEKAERMAQDYSDARGYDSVEQMLDDRKLDAVYICVPPFAHGEIELALAKREIPFLVEKPLGVDLETPTAVLKQVESKGLLTSVGYHFRYMDGTQRAKAMLQEQTVGMALGYWLGGMPGVYWWRKADGSGGQFVEQTTHIIDMLRYLLGEVTEVYAAYGQRSMHEKAEGVSVPDVGTVTLKLASGAVATISNSCMLPVDHWAGLHVYTDGGVLEISSSGLKDIAAGRTTEYNNSSDPYASENEAFIHALRTGDSSRILSSYADAWRSQQIAVAANHSAAIGQPVRI